MWCLERLRRRLERLRLGRLGWLRMDAYPAAGATLARRRGFELLKMHVKLGPAKPSALGGGAGRVRLRNAALHLHRRSGSDQGARTNLMTGDRENGFTLPNDRAFAQFAPNFLSICCPPMSSVFIPKTGSFCFTENSITRSPRRSARAEGVFARSSGSWKRAFRPTRSTKL